MAGGPTLADAETPGMAPRRLGVLVTVCAVLLGAPASQAAGGCPRIADAAGDASYGSLGKGSSDLDLQEISIASGPRTVALVVRLAAMAGTATELRLGARVDVRISLAPVDYFFTARRSGDGTWSYTVTGVRTGADGRPNEVPARAVGGRVDPAAAEVVFVANRSDFVERIDCTVNYRDRSRGCRTAE